jgi:hypothetical protein
LVEREKRCENSREKSNAPVAARDFDVARLSALE